jgi:16S rRNA (cytidine1402-2'-O)-methyltransferase
VTARLLDRYGISKRLIAVHEHNERRAVGEVLNLLSAGKSLALTSDAGTPAVSDPGALVVAAVRKAGFAVVPVPGANAAVTALSAAGLPSTHFLFYGFLPQRAGERRRALAALEGLPYALVFYEAPHRILACLADLQAVLGGERRIVIARELTKLHESMHDGPLAQARDWVAADPDRARGEFVLIVEAAAPRKNDAQADARRTLGILLEALPVSQAVGLAAKLTGGKRNEIYKLALELKKRDK